MTTMTVAPATSPFASDPFYLLGLADAYDEHQDGTPIHVLKQRADELLNTDIPTGDIQPAELYTLGYATGVTGIYMSHVATVTAQTEVAQTWLARKQGRETSTLHTRQHAGR